MRAANYYYSAERFMTPGDEKMAMYHKALRCWHAALERLHPQIERVEVPYEGQSLPAYFLPAPGPGRKRTVVLFDGMDNAKEMSVIFAGLDFAKRGINTLAIDGPGQSETLRLRQIDSRPDYEVAGRAAYDFVAARPEVDPQARERDGLQLRRLSCAARRRHGQALRRLHRARRHVLGHARLADRDHGAARHRRAHRASRRSSSSAG